MRAATFCGKGFCQIATAEHREQSTALETFADTQLCGPTNGVFWERWG